MKNNKTKNNDVILVSRPTLPDLNEFVKSLEIIWERKWLTNNGEFHREFESELAKFLGVKYISLFSNGTLALISALQTLRITGEVITTPYSFVATTHALHWNGIKPVFVDVDPVYGNLDPTKIEAAITPRTTAILPVHVYGNPCNVKEVGQIADIYGLKVIYDAAHAFNVKINNTPILNYGDLSVLSFHATKTFNTIEGGAIVCNDEKTKMRIDYLKNFGFAGETTVVAPGINAKMNEIQAAYGLLQLKSFEGLTEKRKKMANHYKKLLKDIKGIRVLNDMENVEHNYSYFPIFVDKSYPLERDALYALLKENGIHGRRYFYPLISEFPTYKGLSSSNPENIPIASKMTNQVICLPIYPDLELEVIEKIVTIIKNSS
ncbi:MAG: DegT/DnrJ/EryC1/StrS family aminotransferase [Flavobacteriaceae bacterium]|nr:DegT/DnrJ/EryC1/StrS family aminotransferase [Flavobacteriaceae bacterium]